MNVSTCFMLMLDNRAYFAREACFWAFAFRLGYANHEEGQVAEIEAELLA